MWLAALAIVVLAGSPVAADGAAVDPDLDGRQEHAEVAAHGLRIDVTWWTMTGTTHVADSLVLTTSRGALRLEQGDEDDRTLPLLDTIHAAGRDRWVVLGWSSYGGGMQTMHAWLVDGRSATPRVVDTLAWTTDRSHAGLVVDAHDKLRIGIPLPAKGELHDAGDWLLEHGTRTLSLARVRKLPASAQNVMTLHVYNPPIGASASQRGWTGRFVWFSVTKRFVRT